MKGTHRRAWGSDWAGSDEVAWSSAVKTACLVRVSLVESSCIGSGTGGPLVNVAGWWVASSSWQADNCWEIHVALCMKLSKPIVSS